VELLCRLDENGMLVGFPDDVQSDAAGLVVLPEYCGQAVIGGDQLQGSDR
jgi:hypothetical protein